MLASQVTNCSITPSRSSTCCLDQLSNEHLPLRYLIIRNDRSILVHQVAKSLHDEVEPRVQLDHVIIPSIFAKTLRIVRAFHFHPCTER
jgi:hypothetical protein